MTRSTAGELEGSALPLRLRIAQQSVAPLGGSEDEVRVLRIALTQLHPDWRPLRAVWLRQEGSGADSGPDPRGVAAHSGRWLRHGVVVDIVEMQPILASPTFGQRTSVRSTLVAEI